MAKTFQRFWSMIAVIICYVLAMAVLIHGGPEGNEQVSRWAFSLVTLTFTAIFLVSLQLCLNAQTSDSQRQEK